MAHRKCKLLGVAHAGFLLHKIMLVTQVSLAMVQSSVVTNVESYCEKGVLFFNKARTIVNSDSIYVSSLV